MLDQMGTDTDELAAWLRDGTDLDDATVQRIARELARSHKGAQNVH
jgi:hypothetical protein